MDFKNFKRCDKGHMYKKELDSCPYCDDENKTLDKTAFYSNNNDNPTDINSGDTKLDPEKKDKTEVFTGQNNGNISNNAQPFKKPNIMNSDKTIIELPGEKNTNNQQSTRRRLVGWLVSYELDGYGHVCTLYEGKNTIGRDTKNSIVINEGTISGSHALLVFKNNRYLFEDTSSANGTYVNDEEVYGRNVVELKNNDKIQFGKGKAIFKFKTSF